MAIVVVSSNDLKPPYGGPCRYTPVVCGYWPVRIDARLGQQSELVVNDSENVTPRSTSERWTSGIDQSVSHRWSSVTISRIEGGSSSCAIAGAARHRVVTSAAREAEASRKALVGAPERAKKREGTGGRHRERSVPRPRCAAEKRSAMTTDLGPDASYDR